MAHRILIAEDDAFQRELFSGTLARQGFKVTTVENGAQALRVLEKKSELPDIVIMDLHMPEMDGMEALRHISRHYPALPVLMITGDAEVNLAVEAMKLGAEDFLIKPVKPEQLLVSARNLLKMQALQKEVAVLARQGSHAMGFSDIIGHDGGLKSSVTLARKAATADIPVLVTGESGVGKELFARAIHGESHRSGKPFVAVNCGAIPGDLVESTLFGHVRGAFTGAVNDAPGKFREAEGGTLFLDEVGELPAEAQVKLLRALQQREVEPVGAGKTVPVNVRIVAATNRDLQDEVRRGSFREDLFFRLEVFPVHVPPLREHTADIPALIRHFLEHYSVRDNLPLKEISTAAEALLTAYRWPGNIRQLGNVIHRVMVMTEHATLRAEDFAFLLDGAKSTELAQTETLPDAPANVSSSLFDAQGNIRSLEEIEHAAMQLALELHNGNVTAAARALGVAKSTFYRKMQRSES